MREAEASRGLWHVDTTRPPTASSTVSRSCSSETAPTRDAWSANSRPSTSRGRRIRRHSSEMPKAAQDHVADARRDREPLGLDPPRARAGEPSRRRRVGCLQSTQQSGGGQGDGGPACLSFSRIAPRHQHQGRRHEPLPPAGGHDEAPPRCGAQQADDQPCPAPTPDAVQADLHQSVSSGSGGPDLGARRPRHTQRRAPERALHRCLRRWSGLRPAARRSRSRGATSSAWATTAARPTTAASEG